MKIRFISILLLLTIYNLSVFSQITDVQKKAMYIKNFTKTVAWSNEDKIETFKIGVLDDNDMYEELSKFKKLKEKPVSVVKFSAIKDISAVHILYMPEIRNADIDRVWEKISGNSTLLVTDLCQEKEKVMINFLPLDGAKQFEINKSNLTTEKLEASSKLLLYGGTELDVQGIYVNAEKDLKEQKAKVEAQRKELENQKKALEKLKTEIDEQKAQIEKQKSEIAEQQKQIKTQRSSLIKLLADVEKQEAILREKTRIAKEQEEAIKFKEKEIAVKEEEIKKQKEEEAKQRKILDKQKKEMEDQQAKIESQKSVLSDQLTQIETQKLVIYMFVAFAIIVSVLLFFIYRSYKIQKKQKQEISKQNDLLTEQKNEISEKNSVLEQQKEEIMSQAEELRATAEALQASNGQLKKQKEQIQKAYDNAQILSEFGQKITATLDMDAINNMIYDYVSSLMDTSAFGIGVFNQERETIEFKHFMEKGEALPFFTNQISKKNSLAVFCLNNKKEIFINDYEKEKHNYLDSELNNRTSQVPESLIYLPLIFEGRAIGVITVQTYHKNAYSDNDLTNLRSLASYITIALDNANVYGIVNDQNEHITASINYAQTIQQAILPPKEIIDKAFVDNFVFFRPRDIVSGDFYWFHQVGEFGKPGSISFISALDCTGHGVPGAFMSMIGSSILNEIVKEKKIYDTAAILTELDKGIKKGLRQGESDNNDGMDVCFCKIENQNDKSKVSFTGAKRPLIYSDENNEMQIFKGDRKSIGGTISRKKRKFTTNEFIFPKGTTLILTSDGYIDQNNYDRQSFGTINFINLLQKHIDKPLNQLNDILGTSFDNHRGKEEQRDDVTILGIRL